MLENMYNSFWLSAVCSMQEDGTSKSVTGATMSDKIVTEIKVFLFFLVMDYS